MRKVVNIMKNIEKLINSDSTFKTFNGQQMKLLRLILLCKDIEPFNIYFSGFF